MVFVKAHLYGTIHERAFHVQTYCALRESLGTRSWAFSQNYNQKIKMEGEVGGWLPVMPAFFMQKKNRCLWPAPREMCEQ